VVVSHLAFGTLSLRSINAPWWRRSWNVWISCSQDGPQGSQHLIRFSVVHGRFVRELGQVGEASSPYFLSVSVLGPAWATGLRSPGLNGASKGRQLLPQHLHSFEPVAGLIRCGWGLVLARKGIGIQPGFIPEPEAYAMLHCSPECPAICRNAFLRGVPRAHRYHAMVLV
jgi:hypothetical protein